MGIMIDVPEHTIKGVTANGNRKVLVERGLVYDFATNSHVPGFLISVGISSLAVTDDQAWKIAEYIRDDFYAEDFARDEAKRKHPSFKSGSDD